MKSTPTRGRRVWGGTRLRGGILAFALLVPFAIWRWEAEVPVRFVRHWATQFHRCRTPEAIKALPTSERPDLVLFRRFPNGEWVAIRNEFSCTGGAGFDATIYYDSRGKVHCDMRTKHCGYEGLSFDIDSVKATNLDAFFASLVSNGCPLEPMP